MADNTLSLSEIQLGKICVIFYLMGKIFSEFFTNFAVAWLAAGIIAPLFTNQPFSLAVVACSTFISISLIIFAIASTKQNVTFLCEIYSHLVLRWLYT